LIFMECNIWHINGCDCTQKLRELEKGLGTRTHSIGLSASTERQVREKCLQTGMDDYLEKTYTSQWRK